MRERRREEGREGRREEAKEMGWLNLRGLEGGRAKDGYNVHHRPGTWSLQFHG